ncbi:rab11 family-interacting protein 1 [Eupeodes corollae]|uniref:rab11 family-interacting protein 1 n=1 Tax=Eupeodes corollae TaxID=290404 RepID=UPI00248FF603|nr:rab11 family-interacting protein 1 [Eupeodes corollae]
MWSPTHIQVTVQKAKGLLTKGKNGTNNCFVTIALGKEKYQTSVKEKATENVDWHEECELKIPDQGNRAELILTCLHRNNLSIDEFLGQVTLPLNEMDVYDRPRSKWFKLESKPGKEKKKERGELEARITFIVKSGSLTDLSKKEKHKSSIGQLANSVGGSLLSIGTIEKRKGIKKFAKSLGSKMHLNGKKKNKDNIEGDVDSTSGSFASIGTPNSNPGLRRYGQRVGEADPGVISEDEDEFVFDTLSHKSSGSSLNIRGTQSYQRNVPSPLISKEKEIDTTFYSSSNSPPTKPPRNQNEQQLDEWEAKLYGKHLDIGSTDSLKRRSWENSRVPLPANNEEPLRQTESVEKITEQLNTSQPSRKPSPIPVVYEKPSLEFEMDESTHPSTAPNTPVFKSKSKESLRDNSPYRGSDEIPTAMPRSSTMECLTDNNKNSSSVHNSKEMDVSKEKTEKKQRFSKFKYFNKRDKHDSQDELSSSPKVNERIIIGHEKSQTPRSEVSAALAKKYEGKSREELMLLANGMEHEALIQRQRVKELEDYLDNLLLRVMETHPKILQNPYSRTTSTKSG